MARLFFLAALGGAVLVGCGYEIDDDLDFELDFFDITHSSDLHSPYVPGAAVGVWAEAYGGARDDSSTWTFESSDPSVFRVVDGEGGHASLEMVAPGTAALVLRGGEHGDVRTRATIEVGTPVEAELMWHGELLLHHSEEDARVEDARLLVGESGAFLVRFRDAAGRVLSGNRALEVDAAPEVAAHTADTFLAERREWLVVTPTVAGEHEVRISAGGIPVDAFLVTAVESTAVERVVVEGQAETGHRDGDCLVVLAYAEDAEGRAIYGIDYSWDVGGGSIAGFGDVLHYDYDPSLPVMVGAEFEGRRAQAMIHSSGGYFVSDSASLGCSAGGAGAIGGAAPLLLVALFLSRRYRTQKVTERRASRTR